MKWDQLLNTTRVRELKGGKKSIEDHRSEFEKDYDRIIFSSPVRRLKDKTQVFPLDPSDFVRTRLTHSLEVSSVAKGLTGSIVNALKDAGNTEMEEHKGDLKMLSYIGALVHDLGNPPFGHFGEDSICSWFKTEAGAKALLPLERYPELATDLSVFEGNARTTRLLASLQVLADSNGLNLTAATMSASMKYVASSLEANRDGDDHGRAKPGYCQTEKDIVEKVRQVTGTGDARHPLAFIIEAADDTVYSVCDIEDGIRKKAISWHALKEALKEHGLNDFAKKSEDRIISLAKDSDLDLGDGLDEAASVQFRIDAQGEAIQAAKAEFVAHYDEIMEGTFKGELLSDTSEHLGARLVKACKKIGASKVYGVRGNLELELSGQKIIHDLLSLLWQGVSAYEGKPLKGKTFKGKVYGLLSRNYRTLFEHDWKIGAPSGSEIPNDTWRHYLKLMLITDYVAGMTDGYAASLHKSLSNA